MRQHTDEKLLIIEPSENPDERYLGSIGLALFEQAKNGILRGTPFHLVNMMREYKRASRTLPFFGKPIIVCLNPLDYCASDAIQSFIADLEGRGYRVEREESTHSLKLYIIDTVYQETFQELWRNRVTRMKMNLFRKT
jgi:hypothetical protein